MKFKELKINSEIMYYGKQYTILHIDPPKIDIKRTTGDGETIRISFFELVTNPSFHPVPLFSSGSSNENKKYLSIMDSLNEKTKQRVLERFELIYPIIIFKRAKANDIKAIYEFNQKFRNLLRDNETMYDINQKVLMERISENSAVCVRTLKEYLSNYYKAENDANGQGLEGLVTKAGKGVLKRKDNKILTICHPKDPEWILDELEVRIDSKYIPILKQVIEKEYLNVKKISASTTYSIIKAYCIKDGIEPPSINTVYKLLNRIDRKVKCKLRDGKKASEKYESINRGFSNTETLYPLHIVEIDHTRLDMDVIDEMTGFNIGRPWITLGIDVFSRMIWCIYVSLEEPSANRVRKALEHGVLFKRVKQKYNTINEWEVFGIPSIIYMDNGPDFTSINVKRMITETLKSSVMYRPVKTPKYGATIERLFGKLNAELIHNLAGTRKSHYFELGDYDPEKEAILTISDITEILTKYFTDVYPYKPHRGLPIEADTPIVRYMEGLKRTGYPEFILEQDEDRFKIEMLPTDMKPYTRDGVRLENVIYKDDNLSNLISTREIKYQIKYDVDDISRIFLMPSNSTEYIEVLAVNPPADSIKGMNRYTYKKIREIQRSESRNKLHMILSADQIAEGELKLHESVLKKYKTNKTVRAQAKRINFQPINMTPHNPSASNGKRSIKDAIEYARLMEKKGALIEYE